MKRAAKRYAPEQGVIASWLFPLVFLPLTWRWNLLDSATGLDASWVKALHVASAQGLAFGRDVMFVYGPLGFLSYPILGHPVTWALSFVYTVATLIGLAWCALRLTSQRLPRIASYLAAALIAVPAAEMEGLAEHMIVLGFVLALLVVGASLSQRKVTLVAYGLGALAGVNLLGKFDVGVTLAAVFGLLVIGCLRPVARALVSYGAGAVSVLLVFLLPYGPGAAIGYFRSSLEMTLGYAQSLGLENPAASHTWELPAGVATAVGIAVLSVLATRQWAPRSRRTLVAMAVLLAFLGFKHGFVRHDYWHTLIFFWLAAAMAAALTWKREVVPIALALAIWGATLAVAAANNVVTHGTYPGEPWAGQAPAMFVRRFGEQLRALVQPGYRNEHLAASRAEARALLHVDVLRSIDAPVHVEPWMTSVVWAYPELHWRPLPVFHPFLAYTTWLDGQNASMLASPKAPIDILRGQSPATVDGRLPQFDSPQAALEMKCRYVEKTRSVWWQLLVRGEQRCGKATLISRRRFAFGELVTVPQSSRPDMIVVARFKVPPSAAEQLMALMYKPPEIYMRIPGVGIYRLPRGTLGGPNLMWAGTNAQYAPPWQTVNIRSFAFAQSGWPGVGDVEVSFYEVPVSSPVTRTPTLAHR